MGNAQTGEKNNENIPRTVTADADGVRVATGSQADVIATGVGVITGDAKSQPEPQDQFQNFVEGVDDFEKLLAATDASEASFEPGTRVEGIVEVVSLHGREVFLDLGGKANGYILKEELLDEEGHLTVKQGDRVEGVVAGTDFNGIRICRMVSRQNADIGMIKDAYASGLPVEGAVSGTNKGGFDIRLGKVKAFCPFSQIDLYRPADPEALVGQVYRFRVTELKGNTVVVSRAALLREEREENAKELRTKLEVGARVTGTVRSIQKFGVFVDLGGIDGLVHLSELSWTRVDDPHECVELGQSVEVVITEIDEARDRIGLSLKRALADPFVETLEGLAQGAVLTGQVARLTTFGAFVTIAPGVDGMIHVSDMAHRRIRHPKEILSVGDQVEVKVTEIDVDRRRVGLSLKALAEDPWEAVTSIYKVGQTVKGTVVSVQDFGVFVEIRSGLTALLPASETGIPRGKSLGSTFKVGQEIDVQVLRIDANERKMAVTTRDASEIGSSRPERRESRGGGRGPAGPRTSGPRNSGPRVWIDRDDGEDAPVGSLGAALMAALSKKDDE